ncbi:hypothetical protein [Streptomyces malaysiensis]|uniref:hypothetical protein n=1 Tax=Streptomyces malaysiensis TaxID=92644 RepID=UPI002B2CB4C9|nr:hypothetical protein R8789_08790 [Streptomyces malaysiensis]
MTPLGLITDYRSIRSLAATTVGHDEGWRAYVPGNRAVSADTDTAVVDSDPVVTS